MAVKTGDRVRYTQAFVQRMNEGHLFLPGAAKLQGTVIKVSDTPNLTVKQFAVVEWDEPLLMLPQFSTTDMWLDATNLEVML